MLVWFAEVTIFLVFEKQARESPKLAFGGALEGPRGNRGGRQTLNSLGGSGRGHRMKVAGGACCEGVRKCSGTPPTGTRHSWKRLTPKCHRNTQIQWRVCQ